MAGTRHHIIPRFLQKGFASKIDGETISAWQYLKIRKEPKEISTKDTIVSEHFYGKGLLNADDVITELESTKLAPLVDSLREGSCDFEARSRDIAELIAHLSIRSKLVRKGSEDISFRFLDGMKEIFVDEDTIDGMLTSAPKSFIKNQIETVLSDSDRPEISAALEIFERLGMSNESVNELIVEMIENQLQNPETRKESVTQVTALFSSIFDPRRKVVTEAIKEGHIKALIANVVPEPRVEVFERFVWKVQTVDFNLLMGDSPCLFLSQENKELLPICEPKKALVVYLPISSNQLLVGTFESDATEKPSQRINEDIAAVVTNSSLRLSHLSNASI